MMPRDTFLRTRVEALICRVHVAQRNVTDSARDPDRFEQESDVTWGICETLPAAALALALNWRENRLLF